MSTLETGLCGELFKAGETNSNFKLRWFHLHPNGELTWSEFVHLDVIQEMGGSGMVEVAAQAKEFQETVEDNADFFAKKKAAKAELAAVEKANEEFFAHQEVMPERIAVACPPRS